MVVIGLSLILILPLLFYLVDGYYQKNIKKGLYYILCFSIVVFFTFIFLKIYRILFVYTIPIIVTLIVIIGQTLKKNEK
jgi:hypothetical protein